MIVVQNKYGIWIAESGRGTHTVSGYGNTRAIAIANHQQHQKEIPLVLATRLTMTARTARYVPPFAERSASAKQAWITRRAQASAKNKSSRWSTR